MYSDLNVFIILFLMTFYAFLFFLHFLYLCCKININSYAACYYTAVT